MGNLLDFAWALSETANHEDDNWARAWQKLETLPLQDQAIIMAKILKTFTDAQLATWLVALVQSRATGQTDDGVVF